MVRVFDAPITANDQSLDRILAAQMPVLIMFWNGLATPDTLNKTLLNLAREEAGELIVVKIDTQENPEATRRFGIAQTPLLVGLRAGEEVTRVVAPTVADLKAHAQYVLERAPKPEGTHPPTTQNGAKTHPIHVTDAIFEQEVLQSTLPVLVDFWAPWCGPCHMLAPPLDNLAREYAGRLRIAKVNVDQNPYYAGMYGVQGIPTLLMIRDGQVVSRLVGALPESRLRAEIERGVLSD